LTGQDIDRAYKLADLYVLPSVSEPFGITPLEAMRNGTPVIISKTSGVSEVISHCLKVDFWDIEEMASKMLSVLHYPTLHEEIQEQGSREVKKFNWEIPARKCIDVYNKALEGGQW
jgi:glycosyltransferase involved in cell wall biosynthesis